MQPELAHYWRGVKFLPKQEEKALMEAWKGRGDLRARNRVVAAHLPLAAKWAGAAARRYPSVPAEDLAAEAAEGLVKAANAYDPSVGVRFATYAVHHVRAALSPYILRNARAIRMTGSVQKSRAFFQGEHALNAVRRSHPGIGEQQVRRMAAKKLGVDLRHLEEHLSYGEVHLQAPTITPGGDQGGTVADIIADPGARDMDEGAHTLSLQRRMDAALTHLPDRLQVVVRGRYPRDGEQKTLQELSVLLGISRERVRQLEVDALRQLRRLLLQPAVAP